MNVRRLPRLAAQLDFARKLGMDDLVEHTSSIVWIGHSPGSFHDDFADNVVVQLTGTATFIIFPAQCAWLLKKSVGRNRTLAGHAGPLQWVRRGMKRGKGRAPFYHVALKPGDGLAVPSTSMHKVISRDSRRLALNAFFEARPGRMQWPGAPANAFYRHDQSALAMRNLWIKTLRYLWESREVAIAMHTERIELIRRRSATRRRQRCAHRASPPAAGV
ncbi:unnamed protein product [Prorocentrum cordatum]|uniref:Cupin-like domain-containing protein n=1 Tax=Prorocentrum cordatum TaxID=2364126 RepID=A0ABN9SLV6_9DINO|nr:unnamed protein product [Polarella glacialis]